MGFNECKNLGHCGEDLCIPEFCHKYDPIIPSNADRIRAMSDEELAKWLIDLQTVCECCSTEERCEFVRSEDFCRQHILEWLKQPAKGE